MEEVYIIRIKTKPLVSSLYPSERRYSASTVGGLAMVHFGLGVLALLLGSLAGLVQGPILALVCLVPFVSGLLAWKKWYIDRNIGLFFYGSLTSFIVALLCLAATIFDITTIAQGNAPASWSMEHIFGCDPLNNLPASSNRAASTNGSVLLSASNTSSVDDSAGGSDEGSRILTDKSLSDRVLIDFSLNDTLIDEKSSEDDFKLPFKKIDTLEDLVAESSMVQEKRLMGDELDGSSKSGSPEMMRVWENEDGVMHSKLLMATNVLVASLLELVWSLLSARIGLRGMISRVETSCGGNIVTSDKERRQARKKKSQAPRPDILSHYQKNFGSLQSLNSFQGSLNSGPRLPLPESTREFRERVERFLANQADAHRTAENQAS